MKKFMKAGKRNFTSFIKRTNPGLQDTTREKLVNTLMKFYKVKPTQKSKRYDSYKTTDIVKKWVKPHWKDADDYGFALLKNGSRTHSKNGKFLTAALPFDYEHIKLMTAVRDYNEKGLKTKFIAFSLKSITSRKNLIELRLKFEKEIKKICKTLDTVYAKNLDWDKVFEVIGYVPQDTSVEDIKELVPFG